MILSKMVKYLFVDKPARICKKIYYIFENISGCPGYNKKTKIKKVA